MKKTEKIASNDTDLEVKKILYNEMCQNLRFFVEWRFKSITRYIITITALIVAIGWMILLDHPCFWKKWGFSPFLLISVVSFVFYRLEIRNARIHNLVIKYGYEIERKMSDIEGIFAGLNQEFGKSSYTYLLRSAYLGIGTLFAGTGIVLFLINIFNPCIGDSFLPDSQLK